MNTFRCCLDDCVVLKAQGRTTSSAGLDLTSSSLFAWLLCWCESCRQYLSLSGLCATKSSFILMHVQQIGYLLDWHALEQLI
jgi:hypothetical protein